MKLFRKLFAEKILRFARGAVAEKDLWSWMKRQISWRQELRLLRNFLYLRN